MAGSHNPRELPPSYSQLFPEPTSRRSPSPVRQRDSPVQRQYALPRDPFQGGVYCAPSPQPVVERPLQQEYLVVDPNTTCRVQSPVQTFVGQFALAIFTCLCCGGCFGLLALILVGVAQCQASSSPASARRLARTSTICSIIGIVLVFVLAALYFGIYIGLNSGQDDLRPEWKNETFEDNLEILGKRLAEKWVEEKCRDVSRMNSYERSTVTDAITLELIRKCVAAKRRTTTPFY